MVPAWPRASYEHPLPSVPMSGPVSSSASAFRGLLPSPHTPSLDMVICWKSAGGPEKVGPDTGDRNGTPASDLRQGSVWAALEHGGIPPSLVRPTAHAAPRRGPREGGRGSSREGQGSSMQEPVWRLAWPLYDHITTWGRGPGPRKPRPMRPPPSPEARLLLGPVRTTQWGKQGGTALWELWRQGEPRLLWGGEGERRSEKRPLTTSDKP